MKTGVPMRLRWGGVVPEKYTHIMKSWNDRLLFDESDIAQYRLRALKFWKDHGRKATEEAFGVKKSILYLWRKDFKESGGKLLSLVPRSTKPHKTRQMVVDLRLLEFIKQTRQDYGCVGKETLTPLVNAYAVSLGVAGYGASKIGKIIKRNHFNFTGKKTKRKRRKILGLRTKRSPKVFAPGYLEMDCVTVYMNGIRHLFVTGIDVYTRKAHATLVTALSGRTTTRFLIDWQMMLGYKPHTIQTDNGSEFFGTFHEYLERQGLVHVFIYPHSPKVNGFVERFNRTFQDQYVNQCDALWLDDSQEAHSKLNRYLNWYNTVRPHRSLAGQTPQQFTNQYFSNMYAT